MSQFAHFPSANINRTVRMRRPFSRDWLFIAIKTFMRNVLKAFSLLTISVLLTLEKINVIGKFIYLLRHLAWSQAGIFNKIMKKTEKKYFVRTLSYFNFFVTNIVKVKKENLHFIRWKKITVLMNIEIFIFIGTFQSRM